MELTCLCNEPTEIMANMNSAFQNKEHRLVSCVTIIGAPPFQEKVLFK